MNQQGKNSLLSAKQLFSSRFWIFWLIYSWPQINYLQILSSERSLLYRLCLDKGSSSGGLHSHHRSSFSFTFKHLQIKVIVSSAIYAGCCVCKYWQYQDNKVSVMMVVLEGSCGWSGYSWILSFYMPNRQQYQTEGSRGFHICKRVPFLKFLFNWHFKAVQHALINL